MDYNVLFNVYLGFIAVSFIASVTVYFRQNLPIYLRYFSPFLLITIVIEVVAHKMANHNINNNLLYDFFNAFEITFYLFIQYHFFSEKRVKKIIRYLICLYPIIAVADIYKIQGVKRFNAYSYSLGVMMLIFFSVLYFYKRFYRAFATPKALNEPSFWINAALLIFYGSTLPIYGAFNLMLHFSTESLKIIVTLILLINDVFYFFFTIAFFCPSPLKSPDLPYSHKPPVR